MAKKAQKLGFFETKTETKTDDINWDTCKCDDSLSIIQWLVNVLALIGDKKCWTDVWVNDVDGVGTRGVPLFLQEIVALLFQLQN